jgi:hypothetical protein
LHGPSTAVIETPSFLRRAVRLTGGSYAATGRLVRESRARSWQPELGLVFRSLDDDRDEGREAIDVESGQASELAALGSASRFEGGSECGGR